MKVRTQQPDFWMKALIVILAVIAAVLASRAQALLKTKRERMSPAQEASILAAPSQIAVAQEYLREVQRQTAVDHGMSGTVYVRVGDHYVEVTSGFSFESDPDSMWIGDCSACDDDTNYQEGRK